jgi:hypothetical protein
MEPMIGGILPAAKPLDMVRFQPYIPRMSVSREIDWDERLPRPLECRRGTVLKTRSDVRAYVLGLPDGRQNRQHWKPVIQALVAGAPVARVRSLTLTALSLDGDL